MQPLLERIIFKGNLGTGKQFKCVPIFGKSIHRTPSLLQHLTAVSSTFIGSSILRWHDPYARSRCLKYPPSQLELMSKVDFNKLNSKSYDSDDLPDLFLALDSKNMILNRACNIFFRYSGTFALNVEVGVCFICVHAHHSQCSNRLSEDTGDHRPVRVQNTSKSIVHVSHARHPVSMKWRNAT